MSDSRFIIGIDLGTTNISAYYVDTKTAVDEVVNFPIPQVVAAGEVDALPLLPSFCYLPGPNELPKGALKLPWDRAPVVTVGKFARDQGALVPYRLIASAKSWLAHAGVDRTRPILPWGSEVGDQARSPVAATALYLSHIKNAWDQTFKRLKGPNSLPCTLDNQQVIITIPASFDETARELTIAAAYEAGYGEFLLLEEPLAAFYAWLQKNGNDWTRKIKADEKVLIIDIGGGTTDFSIVEMDAEGKLNRFAVGDHLLLGGDNIDIALARMLEEKWNVKLGPTDWAMLCQLCRKAKETILESRRQTADITLLEKGSSILQNMRKAILRRADLLNVLENGFYPDIGTDDPPIRKGAGIRAMGLPYAAEPGITRHLLQFLRFAARVAGTAENGAAEQTPIIFPEKVLFNGGSTKSAYVRQRILSTIAGWFPKRELPKELRGADSTLAVAIGAAYYGLVRRGAGIKVRSGIARSYYLEARDSDGATHLVTVIPRDTDEGVTIHVPGNYLLHTNEKVVFNLFCCAARVLDDPGDIVSATADLSLVAPLVSVIEYEQAEAETVSVNVAARLTEVGTLELVLEAVDDDHQWPLRFDLRPVDDTAAPETAAEAAVVIDTVRMDAAKEMVRECFHGRWSDLRKISAELEAHFEISKRNWPLPLLRELADGIFELKDSRSRSPKHEARWFNLLGYCLRPGFGDPGDNLRLREVWKLWFEARVFRLHPEVAAEWWVFWRRVASGLKVGHQITIAQSLEKILFPEGAVQVSIRHGERARQEMWRCLASLEMLPVGMKTACGNMLLGSSEERRDFEFWVLARLGARQLFHGPETAVLPPEVVAKWVEILVDIGGDVRPAKMRLFAIARLAMMTGDRRFDLPHHILNRAQAFMAEHKCPPRWMDGLQAPIHLTMEEQAKIIGDSLPPGLILVEE